MSGQQIGVVHQQQRPERHAFTTSVVGIVLAIISITACGLRAAAVAQVSDGQLTDLLAQQQAPSEAARIVLALQSADTTGAITSITDYKIGADPDGLLDGTVLTSKASFKDLRLLSSNNSADAIIEVFATQPQLTARLMRLKSIQDQTPFLAENDSLVYSSVSTSRGTVANVMVRLSKDFSPDLVSEYANLFSSLNAVVLSP
jgi:hypothetical protein